MPFLFPFLKPKHPVRELLINLIGHLRIVRIGMMAVVKIHDVEAAPIHIEMDVPFLKIRRDGFPNLYLRVQPFDCTPGRISDAFAMFLRLNEKNLKLPFLFPG